MHKSEEDLRQKVLAALGIPPLHTMTVKDIIDMCLNKIQNGEIVMSNKAVIGLMPQEEENGK